MFSQMKWLVTLGYEKLPSVAFTITGYHSSILYLSLINFIVLEINIYLDKFNFFYIHSKVSFKRQNFIYFLKSMLHIIQTDTYIYKNRR